MAVTQRPAPDDAIRAGRRKLHRAERIDMSALAAELGVNRVTLYRWFGSRDGFLAEVVWSLARDTLEALDAQARRRGGERIAALAHGLLSAAIDHPGMQRLLSLEGEHAMRLLTRHETGFQPRLIGFFERVVRDEERAGQLELPIDARELAYVLVRLIESYAYLDLITGERPDPERARASLRLLLRLD